MGDEVAGCVEIMKILYFYSILSFIYYMKFILRQGSLNFADKHLASFPFLHGSCVYRYSSVRFTTEMLHRLFIYSR